MGNRQVALGRRKRVTWPYSRRGQRPQLDILRRGHGRHYLAWVANHLGPYSEQLGGGGEHPGNMP